MWGPSGKGEVANLGQCEQSGTARHIWAGGAAMAQSGARDRSPREMLVCAAYCMGLDPFSGFSVPRCSHP